MSGTTVSKKLQLKDLIDYKLKVLTTDGTVYVGTLKGFDKYMNMTLLDTYELRITKKSIDNLKNQNSSAAGGDNNSNKENTINQQQPHVHKEKRTLGFIILRGEHILSTSIESQPLLNKKERIHEKKKLDKKFQKFGKSNKPAQDNNKQKKNSSNNTNNNNNKKRKADDDSGKKPNSSKKQKTSSKQLPPGFKQP